MAHEDKAIHKKLGDLFQSINDKPKPDRSNVISTLTTQAELIAPNSGRKLVEALLESRLTSKAEHELTGETKLVVGGYHVVNFVKGTGGEESTKAIVEFVHDLVPGVDVRAWVMGDDDPWEVMIRYDGKKLKSEWYGPDYEQAEEEELPDIYKWWHEGLPDEIREGFINDWKSDD